MEARRVFERVGGQPFVDALVSAFKMSPAPEVAAARFEYFEMAATAMINSGARMDP